MVAVTFWEKPGCANNARQRALLVASGHALEVRNLLTEAWTAERLLAFFGDRPVAAWFNRASPQVKAGEIVPEEMTAEAALAAMLADPLLIRRPLLEVGAAREVGFDAARIDAWIGLAAVERPPGEACPKDGAAHPPCPAPEAPAA